MQVAGKERDRWVAFLRDGHRLIGGQQRRPGLVGELRRELQGKLAPEAEAAGLLGWRLQHRVDEPFLSLKPRERGVCNLGHRICHWRCPCRALRFVSEAVLSNRRAKPDLSRKYWATEGFGPGKRGCWMSQWRQALSCSVQTCGQKAPSPQPSPRGEREKRLRPSLQRRRLFWGSLAPAGRGTG